MKIYNAKWQFKLFHILAVNIEMWNINYWLEKNNYNIQNSHQLIKLQVWQLCLNQPLLRRVLQISDSVHCVLIGGPRPIDKFSYPVKHTCQRLRQVWSDWGRT